MHRCIVAPVDGSAFGEHALPYAVAVAQRSGATLRLVHVHVPLIAPSGVETVAFRGAWSDVTREEERAYLQRLERRIAGAYAVRVESALVEGVVAPALERFARDCGAGLVVMSTHAHTRFRRLWHSGVAEHVARALPLPVLLVRPREEQAEPDLGRTPELRRILIPLDGSAYAEAMVRHAVALGRPFGARYTLLRVIRPEAEPAHGLLGRDGPVNPYQAHRERTAALQYLNAIAERMRASRLEVTTRVAVAEDPAAAIVGYAERVGWGSDEPVDLIAMETHPHRPLARVLGAHTADRVLRDSPVPVLLFEPPLAPAPREAGPAAVARA